MTHPYTELDLRKLKGQELKDVWHKMIGKEAGIKNTTGMKTTEDILQAILKGQSDPSFLTPFQKVRQASESSHKAKVESPVGKPMPKSGESKRRGGEPKVVPQAFESMTPPLKAECIEKRMVKKLHLGSDLVFLDPLTNIVYEAIANTPGVRCGTWDPELREIAYDS